MSGHVPRSARRGAADTTSFVLLTSGSSFSREGFRGQLPTKQPLAAIEIVRLSTLDHGSDATFGCGGAAL